MSLSHQQIASSLPRVRKLLAEWESSSEARPLPPIIAKSDEGTIVQDRDVIVAFRTRPVLPWEASMLKEQINAESKSPDDSSDSEPESLVCSGITMTVQEPGVTVAHVPTMKWNGPTLAHKKFDSDLAFGPTASNDDVFRMTIISNNMIPLALAGGVVCVLAYGQTSAGKTYTMTSLEAMVARDLFKQAAKAGTKIKSEVSSSSKGDGSEVFEITTTFLEIVGKSVYDLGADDHPSDDTERKPVTISEDKIGKVRPEVTFVRVHTSAELESVIERCLSYRRTAPTVKNTTSSRSHAILKIHIKNLLIPELYEGEFILVDLAGSERYEDNKAHSQQRMEETRENNKALLALKECVRARARAGAEDGFVHIPYRTSRLTWVLKPIFDLEETRPSRTVVIAHVSPHIQDVAHSVNTLSYAAPFRILPARRAPAPFDPEDPRTWDHKATIKWLYDAFRNQRQARRETEWQKQDQAAHSANKRLLPLPPLPEDVQCPVDLEKFCPTPNGGSFLGRFYGAEWVQLCLKDRSEDLTADPAVVVEVIKLDSLSVYLELSQLLVFARTRTRKAVMNTRRTVQYIDDDDTSDAPKLSVVEAMEDEERFAFELIYTDEKMRQLRNDLVAQGFKTTNIQSLYWAARDVAVREFRANRLREQEEREKKDLEAGIYDGEWAEFVDIDI